MKFGIELEYTTNESCKYDYACLLDSHKSKYFNLDWDDSCGVEYSSIILSFKDFRKIKSFLKGKREFPLSKRCGFHVHFDRTNLSENQIKNIFSIFSKYEKQIFSLHPKSRSNNKFVRNLSKNNRDVYDHFSAVNLSYYYNTIEFRYGAGTNNYDYVRHWILFIACIIDATQSELPNKKGLLSFFKNIKLSDPFLKRNHKKVISWIIKRTRDKNRDIPYVST